MSVRTISACVVLPCFVRRPDHWETTTEIDGRQNWIARDELQIDAYRGKPAPTITTRFYSLSCGRFGHPKQNRAISLREGAMLQTFPKGYKFKTINFTATGRLIGNAVPPKFAECLGRAIAAQAREHYRKAG